MRLLGKLMFRSVQFQAVAQHYNSNTATLRAVRSGMWAGKVCENPRPVQMRLVAAMLYLFMAMDDQRMNADHARKRFTHSNEL